MQSKRLYRSRDNRMICGVAAGVAAYLDVDPTIVRLIWVVAYGAGWLLIPDEPLID